MDKQAVAFDLDYLAYQYDADGRVLWRMEWRTERVYLVCWPADLVDDEDTYQVRRLADDKPLSAAAPSKLEACDNAYHALMEATYRHGSPLAYSR